MGRLYLLIMTFALLTGACIAPAPPAGASDAEKGVEADDLLAEILARGSIRISTDPNYAPQSFLDASGEFLGFDVDVAREIAARLGVEVEFVTPDWDLITAGNWGGQWDMSVGSMTVTTARKEVLHFASPPYYYTPAQIAGVEGSGVEKLADLDGLAICVGISTTYESWLSNDLEGLGLPQESLYVDSPPADILILALSSDNDCVQQVQAGREEFQAILTSNTVVEAAMAEEIPIYKVGKPVFSENLSVSFDRNASKDATSLVQKVGGIIDSMHEDGTLSALSMEWFGEDLTVDPTK